MNSPLITSPAGLDRAPDNFVGVRDDGVMVILIVDHTSKAMECEAAIELGRSLIGAAVTDVDGEPIVVEGINKEFPKEAALIVGKGLIAKARLVMQNRPKTAEQIIADEALMFRKGIPISFSAHSKIREEAEKTAQFDRDLRRFLPGGIQSEEHVSPPIVTQLPPKKGQLP